MKSSMNVRETLMTGAQAVKPRGGFYSCASAFICGLLLLGSGVANAQIKIGFVNTERVFREAAPAKRAQQILERESSVRNQELAKLEKQGRDLQTELERETVTLTESVRRDKERMLADISRNFQRMQREIREDLNLRRNQELASVQERATRVINQIAEQDKFDLVVQEAVFASTRIDITDKVIRALSDK
jgi:outer membrane protein